jgi:hypothetical protein
MFLTLRINSAEHDKSEGLPLKLYVLSNATSSVGSMQVIQLGNKTPTSRPGRREF